MNPDKYYWSNRASIHHIKRLKEFLPERSDPEKILLSGKPRYIEHIERQLLSADGHRRYDLLIEYDIYHPSHGIYFGCRSTTLPDFNHATETNSALAEWNAVLPLALRRLNNVFPEKDFSCRLRDTDNDNDRTFWPFWISLHEDESPHDVACTALQIFANAYHDYTTGKAIDVPTLEIKPISYPPILSAFTQEAYDAFISRLSANIAIVSDLDHKDSNAKQAIELLESFIQATATAGYIVRSDAYQNAWILNEDVSDIEFSAMVKTLFQIVGERLNLTSPIKIPWRHIIRLFLRHNESPFKEQLKTLHAQHDTITDIYRLATQLLNSHSIKSQLS